MFGDNRLLMNDGMSVEYESMVEASVAMDERGSGAGRGDSAPLGGVPRSTTPGLDIRGGPDIVRSYSMSDMRHHSS